MYMFERQRKERSRYSGMPPFKIFGYFLESNQQGKTRIESEKGNQEINNSKRQKKIAKECQ